MSPLMEPSIRGNTAGLYVKYLSSTQGASHVSLPSGLETDENFFFTAGLCFGALVRRSLYDGLGRKLREAEESFMCLGHCSGKSGYSKP